MSPVLFAFLISLFAGLSTALGGLLPFFPKASDKRVLCFSLGLSAGVMVYISFMELMGEAIDGLAGLYGDRRAGLMALGFFVLGMLVIALIDHLVPEEENPHEFGGGDDRKLGKMGILSALAIALQFIKIQVGANGGSINLGLVPLSLIALRHGPTKGFIAGGLVYGIITCITDGYGFQTYPFDYLIGFGSIAEIGFFSKLCFKGEEGWNPLGFLYIFLGIVLATLVRLIGSTISSMVIYGYDLVAALTYNGIYIPVTGAVTLACMEALYIPIAKVNRIFPVERNA